MMRLRWKIGVATVAALAVASAGLVLAQEKPPMTPPAPPPTVETPPQEPAPTDLPPEKAAPVTAPATNATPPIKAPDDSDDNNDDDNNDKKSKDDDKSKEADGSAAVAETTGVRTRHATAIIQALDKVTAETMRFEVPVGKTIRYKGLVFTVRSCETSAPEELVQDSIAYVQVRAEPKVQSGEETSHQVFSGWMFASSPGLDALEHPVYDAWLIACKA